MFAFEMSLKLSGSIGSRGSSGVAQLRYQWALQLGAVRAALSLAAWAALSAYPSIGATLDLAGALIAGFTFFAGFTNQTQANTSIAK